MTLSFIVLVLKFFLPAHISQTRIFFSELLFLYIVLLLQYCVSFRFAQSFFWDYWVNWLSTIVITTSWLLLIAQSFLSPIRFDDHFFTLWYVFVFTFRIVVFLLVGLKIPRFLNSFLSIHNIFEFIICNICLSASCAYLPLVGAIIAVTSVVLVISDLLYTMSALLSIFSYSSITQLFYVCKLLKMISMLSKNDLEYNFPIRYLLNIV